MPGWVIFWIGLGIILAIFSARENKDGYFFKDSSKSGFGRVVLVSFLVLFLLVAGFIVILLEDWLIAAFPILNQPIAFSQESGSVLYFFPQFPGATWVSWVIVGICIWNILSLMDPDANPFRSVDDIFGHFFLPIIFSSIFVVMSSFLAGFGVDVEVAKILGGVAFVAFILVYGLIAVLFITAFNLFISLFNN